MNSIQNDTNVLAKGAGTALFGKIIGRGLQLVAQILLARLLGPAEFGLYVLGLTVFQLGQQIGPLGLNNGVIHFGGRAFQDNKEDIPTILRTAQILSLGSAFLVGLIVYLLAPWFALKIVHQPELVNVMRGFALGLVFASELRVASAVTRLSHKMHFSVLSEDLLPYIINLGLLIVLFYSIKLSVLSAVMAVIVSYAVGWLVALFFVRRIFNIKSYMGTVPMRLAGEMLMYSLPTFMAVVIVYIINGFTVFLIGYFLSPRDVGAYQVAFQISAFPAIILLAFNTIFAPMISRLNQVSQRPQLNELFKVSTKWGLYSSLPFLLILLFMPQQVLRMLYGQAYIAGIWPLVILTLAQSINTGTGAVGLLLVMNGHQNRWLLLSGISFITALVLDIWLIPLWGIIGAAVANACSIIILYLVALFQVRSLMNLWPYDRRLWKGVLSAGVSACVILLLLRLIPMQSFLQITVAAVVAVGVFLLSLWLLKLDQEDARVLHLLTNIIKMGK